MASGVQGKCVTSAHYIRLAVGEILEGIYRAMLWRWSEGQHRWRARKKAHMKEPTAIAHPSGWSSKKVHRWGRVFCQEFCTKAHGARAGNYPQSNPCPVIFLCSQQSACSTHSSQLLADQLSHPQQTKPVIDVFTRFEEIDVGSIANSLKISQIRVRTFYNSRFITRLTTHLTITCSYTFRA